MNEYDSGTEDSIDFEAIANQFQLSDLQEYDGDISLASKLDDGDDLVVVSSDVYQDAMQARNTLFMNETLTRAAVRRGNDRPCIAEFNDLTCLCDGCMKEREQLIPNDD